MEFKVGDKIRTVGCSALNMNMGEFEGTIKAKFNQTCWWVYCRMNAIDTCLILENSELELVNEI